MKRLQIIEPNVVTCVGRPYGTIEGEYQDTDGEFISVPKGQRLTITKIGCRINKVEPTDTYSMYCFLKAMKPGWKGDYQDGQSGIDFFTCTCGYAGCAGYNSDIRIHRKKDVVRVMGKIKDGYEKGVVGNGMDVVYFSKKQWDAILEYYLDLFRKNPEGIFQDNDGFFTGRRALEFWDK